MRPATLTIFGDPIPAAMLRLAEHVDKALDEAELSTSKATEAIEDAQTAREKCAAEVQKRKDAERLHPRNLGGHNYPFLGHGTSDCEYCECWMGDCRSGGPEGVSPFGSCPGNPLLRDAYRLLKEEIANLKETPCA